MRNYFIQALIELISVIFQRGNYYRENLNIEHVILMTFIS